MIDQASVFAERFRSNPQILQATVLGQGNVPGLDPYTALNALKLIKESNMMAMAGRAQQPTSSPSIVAEALAPAPSPQGLGAMVPNTMGQMPPGAPQGLAAMAPQQRAPVMQRSGGLAGMPTPEESYAEGGIVAFQKGGLNAIAVSDDPTLRMGGEGEGEGDDEEIDTSTGQGVGNAGLQSMVFGELQKSINRMRSIERREPTKAEKAEMFKGIVRQLEDVGGPDIYGDVNRSLTDRTSAVDKNYSQDQGLALIAAAGKVLKGSTLAEGASNAAPAFAQLMGEANKAKQAENRAIESMRFNVNDAQRKERMGNRRAALTAMETARKDELDATNFALNKEKAVSSALGVAMRATRPGAAGAGAGAKPPKLAERLYDDNLANLLETETPKEGESTKAFQARIRAQAGELTAKQVKTTESGPGKLGAQNTQIFVGAAKDSSAEARKMLYTDPVMRSNDRAAISNRYRELYAESIQRRFPNTPLSELLANMPAEELGSVAAPAAGKPAAQKALPMPASKDDLKTNQLYNTSQGLAIWNGKSFVAQ